MSSNTFDGPGAPRKLEAGAILGMGNPLLDVIADVPMEFVTKYGLKMNDAIIATEAHADIFQDMIDNYKVQFVAGGATQNSIRVAQWLSQSAGATSFIGAVGKDAFGEQLTQACKDSGVNPCYFVSTDKPTGSCACLINEGERSLCTRLDAANEYDHSFTQSAGVQELIEKAKVFYISGFFVTVPQGPSSIMAIAEHAAANNKVFSINLSAEFLIEFFSEPLLAAMDYADFVFGNETEAKVFGEKNNISGSIEDIALHISSLPKKNGARPRIVVFSQGSDPTIVSCNGKVTLYPVPPLKKESLVDTNGAGDSFVGGFLCRLAQGFPIEECVRAGHYCARVIIQRSGCTMPDQPDV